VADEELDEGRKVKIVWEVDDRTQAGLDSVIGRQRATMTKLQTSSVAGQTGGAAANFANPQQKAAAEWQKVSQAADQAKGKASKAKVEMENAAVGVKKLAEQAQSTIGKFSGLAGAATLAAAAIGTVAAAVIKWANAEEAAEKKAKKRAAERSARRVQTEADEARIDRENAALELEGRRTRDQTLIRRAQENAAEIERKAALREAEGASRGEVAGLRIKAEEARGTLPKGSMQDTVAAAAIQRQSRFEIAMIKAAQAGPCPRHR
jgi:DNA repair exonuclease SbcCD ATPase subunit